MNKLDTLIKTKTSHILSIYFTAGYPNLNDTNIILKTLDETGVDLVEIGIPFSDPIADGETIQKSGTIALKNGMTLNLLFNQLNSIKQTVNIPKILMGYFNPILQFGIENFLTKCNEVGVDGAIMPDLPLDLFNKKYKEVFEDYNIHFIPLVTPQTSIDRMKIIGEAAKSFVYILSQNSVTGSKVKLESQKEYYELVNQTIPNPTLIGFGIQNKHDYEKACKYGNGAIVGSAFIKSLTISKNLESNITNFIHLFKSN